MESNLILRLVYTFFLGILLALFVGFGINTFYPGPEEPKYPTSLTTNESKVMTKEQEEQQRTFDKKMEQHWEKTKPYNRNVSLITLGAAVLLLTVSMLFQKKLSFIADGVMLGGLFTMLYSIGRGMASEDSKYMFVAVSVGLVVILVLGYSRFVRGHTDS